MNLAFVQSVTVLSHYLGLCIQSHIHFHTGARYSREGWMLFGSWTSSPLRYINSRFIGRVPVITLHCSVVTECGSIHLPMISENVTVCVGAAY